MGKRFTFEFRIGYILSIFDKHQTADFKNVHLDRIKEMKKHISFPDKSRSLFSRIGWIKILSGVRVRNGSIIRGRGNTIFG